MNRVIVLALVGALFASCAPLRNASENALRDANGSGGTRIKRQVFQGNNAFIVMEALSDSVLHFEVARGAGNKQSQSTIYQTPLIRKKDYPGPTQWSGSNSEVRTKNLRVQYDANQFCVSITRLADQSLVQKVCPRGLENGWKELRIQSPETTHAYGLGQYWDNPGSADGNWIGKVWDPTSGGYGNSLRGFSGGANGYTLFPVLYALGKNLVGYGFLLDNIYKQMWDLSGAEWKIGMFGDELRWFTWAGPDVASLRRIFMEMTGKPPVPPKAAFGVWISEFGYDNWDEIESVASGLVKDKFPFDGFGLDIQWFGGRFYERGSDTRGARMGTLQFDPNNFPKPETKVKEFKQKYGAQFLAIEESYVSKFLPEHADLEKRGFLVRNCPFGAPVYLDSNPWWGVGGMIDWTNPEASAYWAKIKRKPLADLGVNFHWTDLGEPEMFSENGCYHGFPELNKHNHSDIHNVYNQQWLEGLAAGYKANAPNRRWFALSRSGNIGIQRTGAGMWSGDIGGNFGALTTHLRNQMHMSFSGIDYYGADIGGFHRPKDMPGTEELYTQWFANAALFDFPVRAHVWNLANDKPTAPNRVGDSNSNRFNARLRYRLAPYYYSLAHEAFRNGTPIVPPPVYYFQQDQAVRNMGNEKMVGPSLLAAVVANFGETQRNVYLPSARWYNFHTGETYDSKGQTFNNVAAKDSKGIFRLPLFAKEGAIIPTAFVDDNTGNMYGMRRDSVKHDELLLHVFEGRTKSEFTLSEDDGETMGYQNGKVRQTLMTLEPSSQGSKLTVAPARGDYDNAVSQRPLHVIYHFWNQVPGRVNLNGQAVPACGSGVAATPCKKQVGREVTLLVPQYQVQNGLSVDFSK